MTSAEDRLNKRKFRDLVASLDAYLDQLADADVSSMTTAQRDGALVAMREVRAGLEELWLRVSAMAHPDDVAAAVAAAADWSHRRPAR